jgi:hypothetical protein
VFLRHGFLAAMAASFSKSMFASSGGRPAQGLDGLDPLQGTSSKQTTPGTWQQHAATLSGFGRDAFSKAVGTNFKVFLDNSQAIWVTLLSVEDLPKIAPANPASFAVPQKGRSAASTSSGFVLVFGGSSTLPQGTHLFQHDSLGNFAMFTVPGGPQVYSATVNRLDQPASVPAPQPGNGAQQKNGSGNSPVKVKALDATSSEVESRSAGLSESQGGQRVVLKD